MLTIVGQSTIIDTEWTRDKTVSVMVLAGLARTALLIINALVAVSIRLILTPEVTDHKGLANLQDDRSILGAILCKLC